MLCVVAVNDPFVMAAWGEANSAGGKVHCFTFGDAFM